MKFNIFTLLAVGLLSLASVSCKKDNVTPNEADPNNAKFSVAVYAAEGGKADVIVSHDGDEALTWYGFLSEDVSTPLADLVAKEAKTVTKDQIKAGTIYKEALTNLKDGVDYRYVVFGITLDGATYGIPAESRAVSALKFTLAAGGHTGESVSVKVEHNGAATNTWYGFLTEDLEADASVLVKENLPAEAAFKTGVKDSIVFEGLKPATSYRYIVTGITSKGVFGEPAEIVLQTAKYAQSKNYKLEYAGFYEDPDYMYINGLKVSVSDNASSKYFLYIDSAESVTDIYSFLDGAISSASSNLLSLASRYNVSVNDILFEGSQTIPVGLRNGKYIAAVITFDEEAEYAGDINWIEFEVVEPKASKVNPDWDLSVLCEPGSADGLYSVTVTNTVAESSAAYPYYLDFVHKNKVDEAGGIEEYINSVVAELGSSLEYIYDQYNYDMTYYGTKSDKYNLVLKGDYVIIAFGFTPETYFFTGQYAYKEVSIPDSSASGSPARVMSSMGFGSGKLNRFAIPSKK